MYGTSRMYGPILCNCFCWGFLRYLTHLPDTFHNYCRWLTICFKPCGGARESQAFLLKRAVDIESEVPLPAYFIPHPERPQASDTFSSYPLLSIVTTKYN